jgi:hypothetical protein
VSSSEVPEVPTDEHQLLQVADVVPAPPRGHRGSSGPTTFSIQGGYLATGTDKGEVCAERTVPAITCCIPVQSRKRGITTWPFSATCGMRVFLDMQLSVYEMEHNCGIKAKARYQSTITRQNEVLNNLKVIAGPGKAAKP